MKRLRFHPAREPRRRVRYPLPDHVRSDAPLRALAVMLRAYHDATVSFPHQRDAAWYLPMREPDQVICYGDVAPDNCPFRNGKPVSFIDLDTAHPAPRIRELAYVAYRFVPLTDAANGDFALPAEEQARRLRPFADAYQLNVNDRAVLADTARGRLEHLGCHIPEQAVAGDDAFAEHVDAGHDSPYRTDAAHIARHARAFTTALMRSDRHESS
jgi:Ser/Thr protein kinase RdoA (MazF antagonist)